MNAGAADRSLIDEAIAAAGIEVWLERRLSTGAQLDDQPLVDRICRELDLLLLGAIADRVRAHDRGAVVKIHVDRPPPSASPCATVRVITELESGHASMRRVAHARLSAPRDMALRVDVEAVGLQIAQVALVFGADEWIAPVRRMSLEVYSETEAGAQERAVLRERELASLVVAARREPVIVQWRDGVATERAVDGSSVARRRFRAPGRDVQSQGDA